jgi:hypothetical protein
LIIDLSISVDFVTFLKKVVSFKDYTFKVENLFSDLIFEFIVGNLAAIQSYPSAEEKCFTIKNLIHRIDFIK